VSQSAETLYLTKLSSAMNLQQYNIFTRFKERYITEGKVHIKFRGSCCTQRHA